MLNNSTAGSLDNHNAQLANIEDPGARFFHRFAPLQRFATARQSAWRATLKRVEIPREENRKSGDGEREKRGEGGGGEEKKRKEEERRDEDGGACVSRYRVSGPRDLRRFVSV